MVPTDSSIVKLPSMSQREMNDVIKRKMICRIGFRGHTYPYIAPFQYTMIGGTLYFHFTNYGRKMRMLRGDGNVCVEIEEYEADMSRFRFVALRGKLKIVNDRRERTQAIKRLMSQGRRKLSRRFLIAHGLSKEEDWSSLDPEKPLVILKLEEMAVRKGLKNC